VGVTASDRSISAWRMPSAARPPADPGADRDGDQWVRADTIERPSISHAVPGRARHRSTQPLPRDVVSSSARERICAHAAYIQLRFQRTGRLRVRVRVRSEAVFLDRERPPDFQSSTPPWQCCTYVRTIRLPVCAPIEPLLLCGANVLSVAPVNVQTCTYLTRPKRACMACQVPPMQGGRASHHNARTCPRLAARPPPQADEREVAQ